MRVQTELTSVTFRAGVSCPYKTAGSALGDRQLLLGALNSLHFMLLHNEHVFPESNSGRYEVVAGGFGESPVRL